LPKPLPASSSLHETIMDLAKAKPRSTVRQLYEGGRALQQDLDEEDFTQAVMELASDGRVDLEESITSSASFAEFLTTWYLCLWFYCVLVVTVLTLVAVYLLPQAYPLVAIRWVAGSGFVLFLPGYVTLRALFPKRELDSVENFALSLGLSLALVPLMGLVLNYTAWGITLDAIIVSLTLYVVIVGCTAARRTFQLLRVNAEPL